MNDALELMAEPDLLDMLPSVRPMGPDGRELVPDLIGGRISYTRAYEELFKLEPMNLPSAEGIVESDYLCDAILIGLNPP